MIKLENIEFTIGESEYSGDLKVPSAVLTSTPQEEELDLTKSPNFQITINDKGNFTDTVEVSFTAEEVQYTANMKVINRIGDIATLQYVDGLTAEDVQEQSVAPEIHYDESTFTVSTTGEGTVKLYVNGEEVENPYTFEQGAEDATYTVTATAQQDGKEVSDTVTIECFVPAASQPEQHTYTVVGTAQLCGEDWNPELADNDMVDEGNNQYSWIRKGLQINDTSSAHFKIVQDHSWDNTWPESDYILELSDTGIYNLEIHFNSDTKEITATPTYVEPLPEPNFIPIFYNQNGSSQRTVTSVYDVSGEDVTQSLNTNNLTETIPAMSSNTKYSIQILDNNGKPIALDENNFSMIDSTGEKTLAFWNSTYNTWVVDFQDENSQGLTAKDFLGDVIIAVNDVYQTKSLPIIRPSIVNSFAEIYGVTVGTQMIIDLESGNNKMYLVDAYMQSTDGTYYRDIIVTDGTGTNILIYNTDSSIADTTNFATRGASDYNGQTLTCKEMKINGSRIKWIAGTGTWYRSDAQLGSTNLSTFTLDDNSTATTDILYPEQTTDYNTATRWPVKINSALITADSADGTVSFSADGKTVTKNLYRCNPTDNTSVYNGQTCVLTGVLNCIADTINWNSLTNTAV